MPSIKHGDMRSYSSGRKKNYNAWGKSKTYTRTFSDYKPQRNFRLNEERIPSLPIRMGVDHSIDKELINKQEISKNYTIAPAYNKGAYQVISKDNIKHIGK